MKKKNIQWVPGLRKQPTFGDTTVHWFARGLTSEERAQKFHTDDESLPTADLGSASDWLKNPRSGEGHVISTQFLQSLLRRIRRGNP